MTQDNKLSTEELTSLSKITGLKEDVITNSGLPDERLKDIFNTYSKRKSFLNKLANGIILGGLIVPTAILSLGYAFNEAAGVQTAFPYAIGTQVLAFIGAFASVIGFDMKYKGEIVNPANEIREAVDARLGELDKKQKQGPSM